MGPFTRILCPIDFSDASQHALEHAVVVAQWYDAAIIGLHVSNPTYAPIGALDLPDDGGTMFASPATSSRLQLQMADALAAAKAAGVPVETCIEEGSPAGRILSGVADHRADLIVMGTHGASGFERLMLGSVTEKVVRKAGVSGAHRAAARARDLPAAVSPDAVSDRLLAGVRRRAGPCAFDGAGGGG